MRSLDNWIKSRLPAAAASNDSVFCMFKACLASLIHHRNWLNETLHSNNPIRVSAFWNEPIPFACCVRTCFPWTRTDDTPEFTGIPIDVLYMAKIEEQNAIIARLESRVVEDNDRVINTVTQHIDKALDNRGVGGEGFVFVMGRAIMDKIDALIEQSARAFAERRDNATNIAAVGVDDTEMADSNGIVEEEDIEFTFEEAELLQEQAIDAAVKEKTKQQLEQRKKNPMLCGVHNGMLNPLLPGWRYPTKMSLEQMVRLWLVGAPAENVPPLKFISSAHVRHFDEGSRRYHDMKAIMAVIEAVARRKGVWRPRHFEGCYWNTITLRKLWDEVLDELIPHMLTVTEKRGQPKSTHKSKPLEQAWRTAGRKLVAKRMLII